MSMEPIQRQMSNPAAGVLNTPVLLQDNVTGLTFIQLNVPNTVLDLYNSPDPAAEAANTAIQGFSYRSVPGLGSGPVAQVMVHGESLPLSQAAISHYQALGVTVSPEVNQTIQSQNSGNATGASSASSNYQAGQAQSMGYSTGRPRR